MSECDFNKITLRHGYSPVHLLHIFRKPFFKNTSVVSLLPLKHVIWRKVINYCCSILHLKGLFPNFILCIPHHSAIGSKNLFFPTISKVTPSNSLLTHFKPLLHPYSTRSFARQCLRDI